MSVFFFFIQILFSNISSAQERLPVVFAHGLGISSTPYEMIIPLKALFKEAGYQLYIAQTPVTDTIEARAKVLRDEIQRLVPHGKFHLIGHSMGGLDSRLVIHKYKMGDRCVSLTTLSTPHRGSPVADYVVKNVNRAGSDAVELLGYLGNDIKAVQNLTTHYMNDVFNVRVPNNPRVRYFSMGFFIPSPVQAYSSIPWLWLSHQIIVEAGRPNNDAMVSVDSARWGEYLGSFAGDHYSETAQVPFGGALMFQDVFRTVLENLDSNF